MFLFILDFKQQCLFWCHFLSRQLFLFIFRLEYYCAFLCHLLFRNIYYDIQVFLYILWYEKHYKFSHMLVDNVQYCTAVQYVFRFKGTATDMRHFARSKLFSLIWQVVFKLGYVFCQEGMNSEKSWQIWQFSVNL